MEQAAMEGAAATRRKGRPVGVSGYDEERKAARAAMFARARELGLSKEDLYIPLGVESFKDQSTEAFRGFLARLNLWDEFLHVNCDHALFNWMEDMMAGKKSLGGVWFFLARWRETIDKTGPLGVAIMARVKRRVERSLLEDGG